MRFRVVQTARALLSLFALSALVACGGEPSMMLSGVGAAAGSGGSGPFAGSGAPLGAAGTAAGGGGSSAGSAAAAGRGAAGNGAGIGTAGTRATAGTGPAAGAGATTAGAPAAGGGGAAAPIGGSSASGAGGTGAAGTAAPAAGSGGAAAPAGDSPCPTGEPCRILPLGDSITYGIGYAGGYRVELFRRARMEGKQITFTGSVMNGPTMVEGAAFPRNNEGHSGWKINQLLPLIPDPAFEPLPHIILLMIGTNDIAQNDNLANAPMRLGALLDKLAMNAPDALIAVATIIPLSRSMAVQTYNAAIPRLVEERVAAGKRILLVDQFTGFPTSELGDGVHPNQQGYNRMARVWYEAIGKLLK